MERKQFVLAQHPDAAFRRVDGLTAIQAPSHRPIVVCVGSERAAWRDAARVMQIEAAAHDMSDGARAALALNLIERARALLVSEGENHRSFVTIAAELRRVRDRIDDLPLNDMPFEDVPESAVVEEGVDE